MAQLRDTKISGKFTLTDNDTTIDDVQEYLQLMNSVLNQNEAGKLILPGGIKIFWGVGTCASYTDPANVYSVKITFPEPFSTAESYAFFSTAYMNTANSGHATSQLTATYYQRTNSSLHVGSGTKSAKFNWLAIGI